MRKVIEDEFRKLTGRDPNFIFCGWGGELDSIEQEIVDEMK